MRTVEREITIPAAPAEVWPALTHSDQLSAWFGADVDLDARPGGRGCFRWADGTERAAVVEEIEPGRRLAFRWLPFQRTRDGEAVTVPSTRVEITLEPAEGGTRVRVLEQPAFSGEATAHATALAAVGA